MLTNTNEFSYIKIKAEIKYKHKATLNKITIAFTTDNLTNAT